VGNLSRDCRQRLGLSREPKAAMVSVQAARWWGNNVSACQARRQQAHARGPVVVYSFQIQSRTATKGHRCCRKNNRRREGRTVVVVLYDSPSVCLATDMIYHELLQELLNHMSDAQQKVL